MAAFSQKDREVREGTPIWLRSPKRIWKLVKEG